MSKARFLVTGGAGFIGSNLVAALVAAGEHVRVLDNCVTGFWEHLDGIEDQSKIDRIDGDIRDAEAVARAMAGVEIVFHEAALGSVPRSVEEPIVSDAVNTGGTVTVLDVARHQKVRRLVFAASSAAYGETPELPKHERITPQPLSPYAVTKLACENYLKVFSQMYGLETVNLRYFNIFGLNQTPDGAYAAAIPRFIDAAISDHPIQIYGDGEQTRDFCYVDNAVLANLLAATSPRKFTGEVINVAGGRRIGLNELCREIARVLGREIAVEHTDPRPGDIRHSLADISLAKELLGFEPLVRWEDGLAPTLAYLSALRGQGRVAAARTLTAARVGTATLGAKK